MCGGILFQAGKKEAGSAADLLAVQRLTGHGLHTFPVCGPTETLPTEIMSAGLLHTFPDCGPTETRNRRYTFLEMLHTSPVCGPAETGKAYQTELYIGGGHGSSLRAPGLRSRSAILEA